MGAPFYSDNDPASPMPPGAAPGRVPSWVYASDGSLGQVADGAVAGVTDPGGGNSAAVAAPMANQPSGPPEPGDNDGASTGLKDPGDNQGASGTSGPSPETARLIAQRNQIAAATPSLREQLAAAGGQLHELRTQMRASGGVPENLQSAIDKYSASLDPARPDPAIVQRLGQARAGLAQWNALNPEYRALQQQHDALVSDVRTRVAAHHDGQERIRQNLSSDDYVRRMGTLPALPMSPGATPGQVPALVGAVAGVTDPGGGRQIADASAATGLTEAGDNARLAAADASAHAQSKELLSALPDNVRRRIAGAVSPELDYDATQTGLDGSVVKHFGLMEIGGAVRDAYLPPERQQAIARFAAAQGADPQMAQRFTDQMTGGRAVQDLQDVLINRPIEEAKAAALEQAGLLQRTAEPDGSVKMRVTDDALPLVAPTLQRAVQLRPDALAFTHTPGPPANVLNAHINAGMQRVVGGADASPVAGVTDPGVSRLVAGVSDPGGDDLPAATSTSAEEAQPNDEAMDAPGIAPSGTSPAPTNAPDSRPDGPAPSTAALPPTSAAAAGAAAGAALSQSALAIADRLGAGPSAPQDWETISAGPLGEAVKAGKISRAEATAIVQRQIARAQARSDARDNGVNPLVDYYARQFSRNSEDINRQAEGFARWQEQHPAAALALEGPNAFNEIAGNYLATGRLQNPYVGRAQMLQSWADYAHDVNAGKTGWVNPALNDSIPAAAANAQGSALASVPALTAGVLAGPELGGGAAISGLGRLGLNALRQLPMAVQSAVQASTEAYDQARQNGASAEEATRQAHAGAWKSLKTLPFYLVPGIGAGVFERAVLPKLANPVLAAGVRAALNGAVNIIGAAGQRGFEGGRLLPNGQDITQEIASSMVPGEGGAHELGGVHSAAHEALPAIHSPTEVPTKMAGEPRSQAVRASGESAAFLPPPIVPPLPPALAGGGEEPGHGAATPVAAKTPPPVESGGHDSAPSPAGAAGAVAGVSDLGGGQPIVTALSPTELTEPSTNTPGEPALSPGDMGEDLPPPFRRTAPEVRGQSPNTPGTKEPRGEPPGGRESAPSQAAAGGPVVEGSGGRKRSRGVPKFPGLTSHADSPPETLATDPRAAGVADKAPSSNKPAPPALPPSAGSVSDNSQESPAGNKKPKTQTLKEWLKDAPDLLEEARREHATHPEWQGINPDETPVFYRSQEEVEAIRAKSGEKGGHHPHGLALGGPEGQKLTYTGDKRGKPNRIHTQATNLQNSIIKIIKKQL